MRPRLDTGRAVRGAWRRLAAPGVVTAAVVLLAACSSGSGPASPRPAAASSTPTTDTTTGAGTAPSGSTPSGAATSSATAPGDGDPAGPATAGDTLKGKVVVIDPGHNGANYLHGGQIGEQVFIGNGMKACDTTGTQTDAGYHESAYNFDVARRLAALLRAGGATVVLTRSDDRGVGPCITERAAIGNRARADAAISIHADGADAAGHGFHVIVPAGIGRNDAIVTPSRALGLAVRDAFRRGTGEPLSTYTGTRTGGLVARSDLGGLNMSTVPKIFIECGNMRNATDARRFTSPAWRQLAAAALAAGLTAYLAERPE